MRFYYLKTIERKLFMKYKKVIYLICTIIASLILKENIPQTQNKSTISNNNKNDYILTRHAKCRMGCREIDDKDIRDILSNGKKNKRKSDASKKPCPILALEGYAKKDSQHIRVIAADCRKKMKIVTVIDLDKKYNCHCD